MKKVFALFAAVAAVVLGVAQFSLATVNVASGNLRESVVLFRLPQGKLLGDFVLIYNSLDGNAVPLGMGWTHICNLKLKLNNNGSYTLFQGNGSRLVLYKNRGRYAPKTSLYPFLILNQDGTSVLEKKEGVFYDFNASGQLVRIRDRNGNQISLEYDQGNLVKVTDSEGRVISLSYLGNRISSIADPLGNVHTFAYMGDDLTSISSQVQGLGVRNWGFTYYPHGFLWTKTDPMGNRKEYFYDNEHRVVKVIDPEGRKREVLYDPAHSQTQFMEKDEGVWTYRYDPTLGVLKARTDPLGNTTSYTHYPDGNLESVIDPRGNRTFYTYDGNGNVTSVTDASGHVIKYTYNSFNKVATMELDPSEPLIHLSYDDRGNLIKLVDQLGVEREYRYGLKGNLIGVKNPLQEVGLEYSPENYLVGVKDLRLVLSLYEYGYDQAGNPIWVKEVQRAEGGEPERMVRFEYNGLGRVIRVTNPAPEFYETHYSYDLNGNLRSIVDGNGNQTAYGYNYRGQVTKVTDALGNNTEFRYGTGCPFCGSGVDRLTLVTDAKGQATAFEYDQVGNLVKEINPMGFVTSYTYDPAGNVLSRTDAKGNVTHYVFDELNRLREIGYPDGTQVIFTYDYRGNVLTAANPHISYSFTYDLNNRLLSVLDSDGKSFSYVYNALGNRVRMVRPDERGVEYRYDLGNYLSQILLDSVPYFSFAHDPYGRRLSLGYPNGLRTRYSYTFSGYRRDLWVENPQGTLVNSFSYTYDAVGNRRSRVDLTGVHEYSYDNIYQLTKALHPAMPKEQFKYDALGNRMKTTVDADNRLLEDNGFTYEYDRNGNLIRERNKKTGERKTLAYDRENRLIGVESSGKVVRYKYDPFGRRIEKEVDGKITRYQYDGANLVLEYGPKGNIKSRYVHSLALDEPLLLERGKRKYYYHADGLGSITDLTDGSGAIVRSYEYKSFGKIYSQTGTLAQPFKFTGREWDPESGLYFYRARYYNPRTGRFLTKDPIGFAGGDVNLYRYVTNNPVNYRDPSGLAAPPWHWLISVAAGLSEGRSWSESAQLAKESMWRDRGTQGRLASDTNIHGMVGIDPLLREPQEPYEAIMNAMQIIADEAACGRHGNALHTVQDLQFFWHAGQEWKGWTHWSAVPHVLLDIFPVRGLWDAFQASRTYLRNQGRR